MSDDIYLINPLTRAATSFGPVRFSEIGIRERSDLQEWILGQPDILGEDLLVVTSEFAGFDRSNRRLDVLALDPEGNLVVIELKLELKQTFADLQALRYAAFCATMTMDQVVDQLATYRGVSKEAASIEIGEFLGADGDDLPEPSDRPRIILVAGSMDEPEVISTVLWLRNFDLDIRCLEVAPYKTSDDQIILVPRLIVPLPEAEAYQVRVEHKESLKAKKSKGPTPYTTLWESIIREFGDLDTLFEITREPARTYLVVSVGERGWHYEWQVKKTAGELHVAAHFESSIRSENMAKIGVLRERASEIAAGVETPLQISEWGKKWAYCAFVVPLAPVLDQPESYASMLAELMDTLMRRSYPILMEYEPSGV